MFTKEAYKGESESANYCVKLWNIPCLLIGLGISYFVISLDEDSQLQLYQLNKECSQMLNQLWLVFVLSALLSPLYISLMYTLTSQTIELEIKEENKQEAQDFIFFSTKQIFFYNPTATEFL